MKLGLALAVVLIAAAVPAMAQSRPHSVGAHIRPQLFHDRSPHIHDRAAQPHHQA